MKRLILAAGAVLLAQFSEGDPGFMPAPDFHVSQPPTGSAGSAPYGVGEPPMLEAPYENDAWFSDDWMWFGFGGGEVGDDGDE